MFSLFGRFVQKGGKVAVGFEGQTREGVRISNVNVYGRTACSISFSVCETVYVEIPESEFDYMNKTMGDETEVRQQRYRQKESNEKSAYIINFRFITIRVGVSVICVRA